jgi:UDP-N-acetylmuramoyl-tripeptide--D-alanyl-D-alanine ligase
MDLGAVRRALSAARSTSRWRMEVHERPDGVTVSTTRTTPTRLDARRARGAARHRPWTGRRRAAPGRSWARCSSWETCRGAEHERVGGWAAESGTDRLVVVGPGAAAIADGAAAAARRRAPR